jgi:hypothetical protein
MFRREKVRIQTQIKLGLYTIGPFLAFMIVFFLIVIVAFVNEFCPFARPVGTVKDGKMFGYRFPPTLVETFFLRRFRLALEFVRGFRFLITRSSGSLPKANVDQEDPKSQQVSHTPRQEIGRKYISMEGKDEDSLNHGKHVAPIQCQ